MSWVSDLKSSFVLSNLMEGGISMCSGRQNHWTLTIFSPDSSTSKSPFTWPISHGSPFWSGVR